MAQHQHAELGDQERKTDIRESHVNRLIAVFRDNGLVEIIKRLIEVQPTLEAKDVTIETPETARIKTSKATIEDQQEQVKAMENTGSSETSSLFSGDNNLPGKIQEKETKLEQQAKSLNQLEEILKNKDREISQLKMRVAALSERRVKQNQSKVEDILSKNRQSEVEEDFANFFDGERVKAHDNILELFQNMKEEIEVEIHCKRLLCVIFEAAYETMVEAREAIFELGKEVTRGFIQLAPEGIKLITKSKKEGVSKTSFEYPVCLGRQESEYPVEAVDALMMILKETASNCNLDYFEMDVFQAAKRKWSRWQEKEKLVRNSRLPHAMSQRHKPLLQEYIKASIQLTWRMVTQTPPLRLEYHSSHLQRYHKNVGYHMSPEVRTLVKGTPDQHQEEEIACYLWPGLFDGEGRCIRKGEVLCKIKGNTE